jgi:hypothetical protein
MSSSPRKLIIAACLSAAALLSPSRAALLYNAYNDFYLSPTASGWGGAVTPTSAGQTWGYYAANVNGFGYPTQIGSYFTPQFSGSGSQNMYQYSSVAPIGSGTYVGASGWAATGGAGFPYYSDTFGWGSSLGRYDTPWFSGAPGFSQVLTNLIWLQSGWLSGGASEGIASVLTWKAAATGVYTFSGLFVSGDQAANTASVAIVDSLNASALSKTVLANNWTQSFSFTSSYTLGDVVQFQVGNNFSSGNAVGLQLEIAAATIPEPSTLFAGLILGGLAFWQTRRRLRSGSANATA